MVIGTPPRVPSVGVDTGAPGPKPVSQLVVWALIGLVVAIAAALMFVGDEVDAPLGRGDTAPGFTLASLDGSGPRSLSAERGHVVLVNFWATWCKPCEEEMPAMERLYRGEASGEFEMLAISVDAERDVVERFQARMGLSFPILLDPDQRISRAYQTTGFPESILIDPEGRILERYVGPRDWDHPDYVARIRRANR